MAHHNRQSRRRDSSSSRGSSEQNIRSDNHGKKRRRAPLSPGGDSREPSPSRLELRQYDKQRRGERDDYDSVNRYRIGGMMDTGRRPPAGPLPEVGKVLRGRVVKIQTFGAFVQLQGYEHQGLVHISQLSSKGRVENVSDVVSEGEQLFVIVLDAQESGPSGRPRISLSRKLVDQETGNKLEKSHEERPSRSGGGRFVGPVPTVGEVLRGKVVNIEPFGAFVRLQGYDHQGLIHISQLSNEFRVSNVSDVVSEGDEVFVLVLESEEQLGNSGHPRISLSMKHVSQETGKELEQSEIQHHGGGGSRGGSRPPIELGAILNAKCTRCGGQGHLAVECFNTTGTRYDLIPEEPVMRGVVHEVDDELHHSKPVGRGKGATVPSWMTDPAFSKNRKKLDKKAAKKAKKKLKKERKKLKKKDRTKKHKKVARNYSSFSSSSSSSTLSRTRSYEVRST